MGFATFVNIITVIFCLAVLVQSVRMMRSLDAVKGASLQQIVQALDTATTQARLVLSELKETLRTDAASTARALASAESIRDELTVMVGIANATADRLLESAGNGAAADGEADEDLLELDRAAA
jgi:ABC-type transporter Mla subunit MlaD